jgi:gliding motility-associated lipoprotein GldD
MYRPLILLCLIVLLSSCYTEDFTPKKRGYAFIELPKDKVYQLFNDASYPYTFEYPQYGKLVKDSIFFGKAAENPFWMNVDFEKLGGKLYLTYKPISSRNDFEKMIGDAYKMSYAHDKKASYINEPEFHTANNVHGVWYEVGGNAASAYQFYATDSYKHFIRGALYFDAIPNADSLAPVVNFLSKDMQVFIHSLKWTK